MTVLPIVTLDGPAGVGKTSLAQMLATHLGVAYLDTGAMFRCLALKLGTNVQNLSEKEIERQSSLWKFSLYGNGAATRLLCNEHMVHDEIRTEEVAAMASKLATVPVIREILKQTQRRIGHKTPLVAEGRDMGSIVFSTAQYKFFLDASPEIRAFRRMRQLEERNETVDLALLTEQIRTRDALDRNRSIAPLRPAHDAIIVDTSHMNVDGVFETLLQYIADGGGLLSV